MGDGTIILQLVAKVEADVVRGCCGGNHEFGECPLAVTNSSNESEED